MVVASVKQFSTLDLTCNDLHHIDAIVKFIRAARLQLIRSQLSRHVLSEKNHDYKLITNLIVQHTDKILT